MRLAQALRVHRGDVISFIGAGGKTTALFRLGRELTSRRWRVIGTTTTRVAVEELHYAPWVLPVNESPDFDTITKALSKYHFVFLYRQLQSGKALGIGLDMVGRLLDRVSSDVLLIEADGARRLPFKAPYAHEPVIPAETTRVVLSVGMDVLGRPLDSEHVYNPEAMIQRYGYPAGSPILWPWVASVLRDEHLGLRNVAPGMPVTVLLNKTLPGSGMHWRARLMASLLLRSPRIRAVAIGAVQSATEPILEVRRPVAAIVLAAGLSSRMGRAKVLLPWGNGTVLEAILQRLFMTRLTQVVVVTGHYADRVEAVASKFDVRTVHNPDYAAGEMLSSLQVGIRALDDRIAACLVVLGDQPQIQGHVIARVLSAYAEGRGTIIAPSYQMRRGHPILIDREHWAALLELPSGSSPRDLINARTDEIAYVNVNTDSILADIDTPEDYEQARRRAGLA